MKMNCKGSVNNIMTDAIHVTNGMTKAERRSMIALDGLVDT